MKKQAFLKSIESTIQTYRRLNSLLQTREFARRAFDELAAKIGMKEKEMREKHREKYKIWLSSDGRWKTRVPDNSKERGAKLIARSTEESLHEAIVKWYSSDLMPDTLEKIYPEWISYKAMETTKANAHKLSWTWKRYYAGDPIIRRKVSDLKVIEVKRWLLGKIEERRLNSKQYRELKSVINGLLDYAIELELVSLNVARSVRGISRKHFEVCPRKPATEQVYMVDEKDALFEICERQFKKTRNTAYLGICLNFYLGLRVGELVALKVSDFSDLFVHIEREEIKTYREENGEFIREGYAIVPYTKTPDSVRDVPLTSEARKYVKRIIEANRENGLESEFLFMGIRTRQRMKNDGINNTLRRVNKKLDTSQKGNHGIRKTYISTLDAFSDLSDEEIRTVAGHKYISTTQNSYMYSVQRPENRIVQFENALNARGVTTSNHKVPKRKSAGNH